VYLEDTYKFELDAATIQKVTVVDGSADTVEVILDQTIFHPQGGGQACDVGKLVSSGKEVMDVIDVRKQPSGVITHKGTLKEGSTADDLQPGMSVSLLIDEERRRLNARLHSAGHLLDVAMRMIGFDFLPTKGNHAPGNSSVEYIGEIPADQREEVAKKLEAKANELIRAGTDVEVHQQVAFDDIKAMCGFVPDYLPQHMPARIVRIVHHEDACPCGGTHVDKTSTIGTLKVTKIKKAKKAIKVGYELS